MTVDNSDGLNELGSKETQLQSENGTAKPTTGKETEINGIVTEDVTVKDETPEIKAEVPEDSSITDSNPSAHQTPLLTHKISSSSHPSPAQGLPPELKDGGSVSAVSPSGGVPSAGRLESAERQPPPSDGVPPSAAAGGTASAATVSAALTSRISSLSAAAGASLRDMIAHSSVVKGSPDSVKAEDDDGGGSSGRRQGDAVEEVSRNVHSTEPETVTGDDGAEGGGTEESAMMTGNKEEVSVKQELPDYSEVASAETRAADDPIASLKTQESEAFVPTSSFSPEREWQTNQTPTGATSVPRSSATSSRRVKIVKKEEPPSGRRSSSYLYNDWDRTLYEKTGRPPPGEAHWSPERGSRHSHSPNRSCGTGRCPNSRTSSRPATHSSAARRQRSRNRPATSPHRPRPFDMVRCRRETQDQFGRRILFHHCFIEPEFTLRGQRIPVHGARKGSIITAEDTYAGFALQLVTPTTESQLLARKLERRMCVRKKRRRRRRFPSGKSAKRERRLIAEQWQRLEEEGEKLEDDKMLLQQTRQHLERLEEWWQTEGLLILQRDEVRAKEERIINAVIEEECLRINEEKARIQQECQLLMERMQRQEKEEIRIQEELNALDEKQEELTQHEEIELRRIREMKAVFEIERRMMAVDRKQLVDDALTCDALREALEDAELGGWETLSNDARNSKNAFSATNAEPTQHRVGDPFPESKGVKLQRFVTEDVRLPAVPEPIQLSLIPAAAEPNRHPPTLASPKPEQSSTSTPEDDGGRSSIAISDPPHQRRPLRPITARGRPVRASRSTPSGDSMAHQATRPLSAARSEGLGLLVSATEIHNIVGEETVDVWRRRPTVMQPNDISNVMFAADEDHLTGNRDENNPSRVPEALTMPEDPTDPPEDPMGVAAPTSGNSSDRGSTDLLVLNETGLRTSTGGVGVTLGAESQPEKQRPSLTSTDAGPQRHVSFPERTSTQPTGDQAEDEDGDDAGDRDAEETAGRVVGDGGAEDDDGSAKDDRFEDGENGDTKSD